MKPLFRNAIFIPMLALSCQIFQVTSSTAEGAQTGGVRIKISDNKAEFWENGEATGFPFKPRKDWKPFFFAPSDVFPEWMADEKEPNLWAYALSPNMVCGVLSS